MAVIVLGVPAAAVVKVWPHVEAHVDRALRHANGCYLAADLRDACTRTELQLWLAADTETGEIVAAVLTRIAVYPRRKSLAVPWVGGRRMKEWLPQMSETLEAFARHVGCDFMEGAARRGWLRVTGARSLGEMFCKEL